MNSNPDKSLVDAYSAIVRHLSSGTKDDHLLRNFEGTPERAAKALLDMCKSDAHISERITQIIKDSFPLSSEMSSAVTQGPIRINSMCPHHLLPVIYEAYVAYIPKRGNSVIGLSKLARLCKELGSRPVLHEQLASDIVSVLHKPKGKFNFPSIESEGSAVSLIGAHMCMVCRGVTSDTLTSVIEFRGAYINQLNTNVFFSEIDMMRKTRIL